MKRIITVLTCVSSAATASAWAYLNGTTNKASFGSGYKWSRPSYVVEHF
ncbi:MAG: hypothetical protein LBG70_03225 [Bifidobacteriaceae bacterium]|nr:hypothetical protein [Bifidobacteriaceae bacterium]